MAEREGGVEGVVVVAVVVVLTDFLRKKGEGSPKNIFDDGLNLGSFRLLGLRKVVAGALGVVVGVEGEVGGESGVGEKVEGKETGANRNPSQINSDISLSAPCPFPSPSPSPSPPSLSNQIPPPSLL